MTKKIWMIIAAVVIVIAGVVFGLVKYKQSVEQRSQELIQRQIEEEAAEEAAEKAARQAKLQQAGAEARQWAEDNRNWVAQMAQEPGMKQTESGVVYKVLEEGNGAVPTTGDAVRVHYEGSDINGEVFDSSYERGESITFGVTQVIRGWTEILCMMPVGSKWEVYIPAELAYGEGGAGSIRPNSTLKFIIELLGIE